ncbi:hypothetical protein [Argonema galeatum]|uniref:hypothetical protein n=1 Tax=Argonema galeatum TaxID=2942762 RepID=UPI0020134AB9|nr:hypothetical protein [Argonema galeatum]MCL1464026.1 hypothetical protein [Argonema galeatum A003/A1]
MKFYNSKSLCLTTEVAALRVLSPAYAASRNFGILILDRVGGLCSFSRAFRRQAAR